jgi:UDP-glucose:(heptosyl)LPS alpha-1,3-glucosyltransferase
VICTSQREADNLSRLYGVAHTQSVVVPNGFDGARFSPAHRREWRTHERSRLGLAEGDIALFLVANELHRKGFGQTIEAMARLKSPQLSLHVAGRMPLTHYERTIRELGLAGRVSYHGSTAEVERLYAAADALVLPTQYEPFGLVIIEAMAMGLPVITTTRAGASQAIEDGVSGFLQQDPYDVDELMTLIKLLEDPERREAVGESAALAAAPYEWSRVLARAEPIVLGA